MRNYETKERQWGKFLAVVNERSYIDINVENLSPPFENRWKIYEAEKYRRIFEMAGVVENKCLRFGE